MFLANILEMFAQTPLTENQTITTLRQFCSSNEKLAMLVQVQLFLSDNYYKIHESGGE